MDESKYINDSFFNSDKQDFNIDFHELQANQFFNNYQIEDFDEIDRQILNNPQSIFSNKRLIDNKFYDKFISIMI